MAISNSHITGSIASVRKVIERIAALFRFHRTACCLVSKSYGATGIVAPPSMFTKTQFPPAGTADESVGT